MKPMWLVFQWIRNGVQRLRTTGKIIWAVILLALLASYIYLWTTHWIIATFIAGVLIGYVCLVQFFDWINRPK